jgi:membrane protein DedA with SNARE-associated domain
MFVAIGTFELDRREAFLIGAVALLLLAAALASIWRSRVHSSSVRIIWTVLVVALPIVGPIAWYLLGRERRRSH